MCYRGQTGTLTNAVIMFCCPILTTKSFYEVFHILFLEARRAFEPPFYTAGTWCSERLTDLPQVTQLVSGRTGTRLQAPFPYTDCIYPITSWLTTSAISQMLDRRTKPVVQTHWLSNFMGQLCITGFEQRLKRPLMLCSLVLSLIHFLHTWTSEDYCTSSATQVEQEGCSVYAPTPCPMKIQKEEFIDTDHCQLAKHLTEVIYWFYFIYTLADFLCVGSILSSVYNKEMKL